MTLFSGIFSKSNNNNKVTAAAAAATAAPNKSGKNNHPSQYQDPMESRLRGALWGFFAGDALAAPTHWYYGGRHQILQEYGHVITDYTKPNTQLRGSILNKSDLNGGGRSKSISSFFGGGGGDSKKAIIGDVINHGKQELWSPNKQIHYHATLQRGENTLEVSIARVLMKSIVSQNGKFDPKTFQNDYIKFMTTPGSHNDTYASTCHRMFFSNLIHQQLPPDQCPDNDHHNVDTIDGLILPTIAAMTELTDSTAAGEAAAQCAAVTRKSQILEQVSRLWANVVVGTIQDAKTTEDEQTSSVDYLTAFSQATLRRNPNPRSNDALTACYLQQSLPGLIDMIDKYGRRNDNNDNDKNNTTITVWEALLANANVGGENVHRGSVLGAILGGQKGYNEMIHNTPQLFDGLYHSQELAQEIDDFVSAVLPTKTNRDKGNENNNKMNNTPVKEL